MSLSLITQNAPMVQKKCQWEYFTDGKAIAQRALLVCELTDNQLFGPNRIREFVEPRHIVRLAMRNAGLSFKQIARLTGCDDHTSVLYSCNRARVLIVKYPALADMLAEIEAGA
jgi:chromosomal replication initiation ATPase DnaA